MSAAAAPTVAEGATVATPKTFATLQARAALAGYSCHYTTIGNVILCRFGGGWIFDTVELADGWLTRRQEVR